MNNYILTSILDGVRLIKFNRPSRKNALLVEMYTQLTEILFSDATNDSVVATIFTGEGEYYSSGNDFTPSINDETDDFEQIVIRKTEITKQLVTALIEYPKLLIAVVNGPAIGFAVTILALFDVVYASERATFSTPFIQLGLCPEACSSYLFPLIMGRSKASQMLLLGEKMSAKEALGCGLIAEVIPHEQLGVFMQQLQKYGKLPRKSIINAKSLINNNLKETLNKTNECEYIMLVESLMSEEFFLGLTKFISRKSKL